MAFALVGPLLLCVNPGSARAALAQQRTQLVGLVVDQQNGEPVVSASITIPAAGLSTETSADGSFAFSNLAVGLVSLRVEAMGYPAVVEDMEVEADAEHIVQIVLPTIQAFLEELVVVGRSSRPESARTAADLVARQLSGVNMSGGVVGVNDSPLMLRGLNSLVLSAEPAIFLDGVRMSGGTIDLLMEIPAAVVKNIRILRGPSSTEAPLSATGSIYIETRSGPDGR